MLQVGLGAVAAQAGPLEVVVGWRPMWLASVEVVGSAVEIAVEIVGSAVEVVVEFVHGFVGARSHSAREC